MGDNGCVGNIAGGEKYLESDVFLRQHILAIFLNIAPYKHSVFCGFNIQSSNSKHSVRIGVRLYLYV